MPTYVLDTSILVGYTRGAPYAEYIEKTYSVSKPPNIALISIVTKGEIYSLGLQLGWGAQKLATLDQLLLSIPSVPVQSEELIRCYSAIDAFSQGKHPTKPLPAGLSARNMGKNDLWIAATASLLKATLLTTDRDFDHLNGVFLTVIFIDPSNSK